MDSVDVCMLVPLYSCLTPIVHSVLNEGMCKLTLHCKKKMSVNVSNISYYDLIRNLIKHLFSLFLDARAHSVFLTYWQIIFLRFGNK